MNNQKTFEELMLQHICSDVLMQVKEQIPTLTIFVPVLPENSFSADTWDINNEIPVVGIRTNETNDVPVFDETGNESIIESYIIPGYPIVVIKDNERIVAKKTTSLLRSSNESINLYFCDEAFDNTNKEDNTLTMLKSSTRPSTNPSISDSDVPENRRKILTAYDIYKGISGVLCKT